MTENWVNICFMELTQYHTQFFTATILEWQRLLKPAKYKDIIVDSLRFLVKEKRVEINAFVIMENYLHLIWQILAGHKREDVQRDFLKFTAQHIKSDLMQNHPLVLPYFEVNAKDRKYQFWERNPLSIDLYSQRVFMQKLDYLHWNPVRAGVCKLPEEYWYSSARFYELGQDDFGFITHFRS
jgi:REP element-mobilizing transposase RayT